MGRPLWKGFFSLELGNKKVSRSTYITRFMLGKRFIVQDGKRGKNVTKLVNLKTLNKRFGEFIFTRKTVVHKKKKKKKKK